MDFASPTLSGTVEGGEEEPHVHIAAAPQVRVVNGQIVLNEESLVLTQPDTAPGKITMMQSIVWSA